MIQQFTYTASPWGKSDAGWQIFQQSRNVAADVAEKLREVYRYEELKRPTSGEAHPIQFVYLPSPSGGGAVLAQSAFTGMRWWGYPRPGDFFAHVLLLDKDAVEKSCKAGFNPVRLFMSPKLQSDFPADNGLKEKALRIFRKETAWEAPPELPELQSLSDLPENPQLAFDAALDAIPEHAVEQLGAVVRAIVRRTTGNAGRPIVFDSGNKFSPFVMTLALDLIPPAWRAQTWFAVHFTESALRRLPTFNSLTFYGTDGTASSYPDSGIASGVDFAEDPFNFIGRNDVRAFKKQLNLIGINVSFDDYKGLIGCRRITSEKATDLASLRSAMSFADKFPGLKDEIGTGWKAIDEALSELEGRVGLPDFVGLADEIGTALHLSSLQGELIDERKERLRKAICDHESEIATTMNKKMDEALLYTPQGQDTVRAKCAELSDAVRMALISGDIETAESGSGEIFIISPFDDTGIKLQEDIDRVKSFRHNEEDREIAKHLKPVRDVKVLASREGIPRIVVSWQPEPSGLATEYRVLREDLRAKDITKSFTCLNTLLTDTDVASGVPYRYTIVPCYRGNVALENVAVMTPIVVSTAPTSQSQKHDNNFALLTLCPICGKHNQITDTFKCRVCGRDNLCMKHCDDSENCCKDCAAEQRKAREQKEREAQEESLCSRACLETGICRSITLPGGATIEMIYCPPGEFMMGSPLTEEGRCHDEVQHRVKLTKGFWLGKYPVTQAQWKSVMGNNPSYFRGEDLPVEMVSWDACQNFIKRVNVALGCGARLPAEAEWEYACRAGTIGPYSGTGNLDDMGWYKNNSSHGTRPVGQTKSNAWDLYDMHGNVYEWCNDWYGSYPSGYMVDPTGYESGFSRVVRGGCWSVDAGDCRSASRSTYFPSCCSIIHGFRLCCDEITADFNNIRIESAVHKDSVLVDLKNNKYRGTARCLKALDDVSVAASSGESPLATKSVYDDIELADGECLTISSSTGDVHVGGSAKLTCKGSCYGDVDIDDGGMFRCSSLTGDIHMDYDVDLMCGGSCYGDIDTGDRTRLSFSSIIGDVRIGNATNLDCIGSCYEDVTIGDQSFFHSEGLTGDVHVGEGAKFVSKRSCYGDVEIEKNGVVERVGSLTGDIIDRGGKFRISGSFYGKVEKWLPDNMVRRKK